MNKPDSLRAHLLAEVPALEHDPDRLLIFIDNGTVHCTAARGLSYEYAYQLQMIFTDFAGHPDTIMVPLLAWLRINQSELLVNLDKSADGIRFEVEVLDSSKVDMSLTLPLTERVIVKLQDDGSHCGTHPAEPVHE